MNFVYDIIEKRNGNILSDEAINRFVKGVTEKTIPDYQISAMLMAICIKGMNIAETAALTRAMTYSGEILDLSQIEGIKVDKHSTGGVADTTTLILAPLTASLGLPVVKMSGHGLGHTGGTLDKLSSIPGFNISLTKEQAIEQVNRHGIVIMGQTQSLVPADKYLYALRDVTGTVESIPLIASSILSKKLAAGADAIVLDVKYGSGAFMKTVEAAKELAQAMADIGRHMQRDVRILITSMEQPLGTNIGNSLELIEAIEILKGNYEGDLKEVALALGAQMLMAGGICKDKAEAYKGMNENIANGKGLAKLAELIEAQGGNSEVINNYALMWTRESTLSIKANESGYISSLDTTQIGRAATQTGAGRYTKSDIIDYSAGIIMHKRLGERVSIGDEIATLYAADSDKCRAAAAMLEQAITIGDKPKEPELIIEPE